MVFAFWLNTGFAILEIAGGLYTQSVAVLSDALHDFGDSLSIGLSYYFHKKSAKKRDEAFSYGYKRFSLLGAFINSVVLILGSAFVIQESVSRLFTPVQPDPRGMLLLAVIGVVVNGIAMVRLRSGVTIQESVLSLHFLEDILGWIAVLVGSVVMMFVNAPFIDPLLSLLIAAFILFNVYRNLRRAFQIILQGIPENVDVGEIERSVRSIKGVVGIHDLHAWSMDGHYNIMTLHMVVNPETGQKELDAIKEVVRSKVLSQNIQHLTIETEFEDEECALKEC